MSAVAKKKPAKPVYMTWERLVRPDTGESVMAITGRYKGDRESLKARGYRPGDEVRVEIKRPRNPKFHRLAHALGGLAVDQIEGFEALDHHGALKRLQSESGVCCVEEVFDLPGFGTITRKVPESIAFDEMPEERFIELWTGVCRHIVAKYWPTLTEDQVGHQAELIAGTSL